jgi:hypothetical protein
MAYTLATASKVMTERIEPVLRSAFLVGTDEEAPTFDLFMKGEKERTNELGRRIPIRVTPNASYGSITEGGQLPLAGTPEIVQLRIYYLNQFMMGEINRAVLDQATETDLVKFMRTPMEDDQRTFRRIQNLWMHGTGSGALGVATAVTTGAAGTVTFGGDYGAENIIKGARLVFFSSAGSAHNQSGAVTVSTVTGIAGDVVTFDNVPTDVVATDTAHYYGSKDLAPHGIPYHVSETSSTYLGVDTATYGGIKSTIVDAGASSGAGGTALTPGMLDLMEAKRRRRSGANASRRGRTYISHTAQEFNYRQLGYTTTYGIQRVMSVNSADDRKFDLAIGKASHNGANWILDNQAPKSVIWDLHLPDWALEYVVLPKFYDDGNGNKLWMKSGSGAPYDALQYAVYARYDLLCKNRGNQSAIINLPYIAGL